MIFQNTVTASRFVLSAVAVGTMMFAHPAHAFFGDSGRVFGNFVADIVTAGGAGRDRDFEACVRAKENEAAGLLNQITSIQGQIDVSKTSAAGATAQIQQALQEEALIKSEADKIGILLTALQTIENQSGLLQTVLSQLNQLMDVELQNKRSLESWKSALTQMIPTLEKSSQNAANVLLKQLELATSTNDSKVIDSLIRVLEAPAENNLEQIKTAWVEFTSQRQTRLRQLSALRAEREAKVTAEAASRASLQTQKSGLEQKRSEVLNRGC